MSEYEKHRMMVEPEEREKTADLLRAHPITDQASYRAFLHEVSVLVAVGSITPDAADRIKDMAAQVFQSLVQERTESIAERLASRTQPLLPEPTQDRGVLDVTFTPAYEVVSTDD